ncbi:MAG: diguanylate cyclase [Clostridiales bacterium]|nr:diguanylate cyclase [Clostridiales bacterium]
MDCLLQNAKAPLLVNGFSLIILFVFLFTSYQKSHKVQSRKFKLFQYIVITNIFLLLADTVNFVVAGHAVDSLRTVQVIATTIFYTLDPLPSFFFICFTDVSLNVPEEKQKRLRRWYLIPVVLHTLIAVATPFTGWFFSIDALNVYHRGPLHSLSFVLSFILLLIAVGEILVRYLMAGRNNAVVAKNVSQYGWLLRFTVIPLIGGVLQIFDNSVTYVWNATVISLLLLFINNQNDEITTDSLTGLYNRRQAFAYFERFEREWERTKDKTAVAVVVLDINNFKCINDRHGHTAGDDAIIAVARSLETEFQWDDFICRFGGDEFLVITRHGQKANLVSAVDRVNANLERIIKEKEIKHELSVSAGYAVLTRKTRTLDQLFQKADSMMFEQKARLKRRASDRQG